MRSCNKSLLYLNRIQVLFKENKPVSTGYLTALQHRGVKITVVYLGTDSAVWAPENNPSLTCSRTFCRTHFSSYSHRFVFSKKHLYKFIWKLEFPKVRWAEHMTCPMVPVLWWWNWWNAKLFGWSPAVCTGWPFGKKAQTALTAAGDGVMQRPPQLQPETSPNKMHQTVSETLLCFGLVSGDTQQSLNRSPSAPQPVLKAKERKMIPSPSLYFRNYWLIPKERQWLIASKLPLTDSCFSLAGTS